MAARIRSLRNGITPVDSLSRDDLVIADVVTVQTIDAASTYHWSLVFAPEDIAGAPSTATFSGAVADPSPGSFVVDHNGPYLVRLVVDQGLATEDTQYVRLRALTTPLALTLVSAGERRDGTGTIPVDVSVEGWANEQNFNLLKLQASATAAESLQDTLLAGSTTGGTDITLTTGDKLVGQTHVVIEAINAGSNVDVTAGAGGALNVAGKVDVQTGLAQTQPALGLSSTADSVALYVGGIDPSLAAGLAAPEGSLFFRGTVGSGQCWLKEGAADTAWAQLSTAAAETLAQTLTAGNTSGGTNIQLDTGDELVGQTDVVLRSTGAASNIELNPDAAGSVVVNGKLTVTGLIDPTGLILSEAPAPTTIASEGAIFVSDGTGSLSQNGLYYRSASAGSSTGLLNPPNEVLITQLSDFPTPAAGVITLASGTLYRISGIVDINANILSTAIGGSILLAGGSRNSDQLTTNNATALIQLLQDAPLQVSELRVTNSGGPVFDVAGPGSACDVYLSRTEMVDSPSVGTFSGTSSLDIQDCVISNCQDGFALNGLNELVKASNLAVSGANVGFSGMSTVAGATIGEMSYSYGTMALSNNAAAGLNLNAATVITRPPARFNSVAFSGVGIPLTGITPADPNYEFFQCAGIPDSVTFGSAGFSAASPQTLTIGAIGTYYDVATAPVLPIWGLIPTSERFTLSDNQNGTLAYTGAKAVTAAVRLRVTVAVDAVSTRPISMHLLREPVGGGGYVILPDSEFFSSAGPDPTLFLTECVLALEPGDQIKAQVRVVSGALVDLKVWTARFDIQPVAL
jgi:hypothetical protein